MNPQSIVAHVKELLAQNRYNTKILSHLNGTRIHNHLVCKPTLNNLVKLVRLAKWLSVRLQANWLLVRVPLHFLKSVSRLLLKNWKIYELHRYFAKIMKVLFHH